MRKTDSSAARSKHESGSAEERLSESDFLCIFMLLIIDNSLIWKRVRDAK